MKKSFIIFWTLLCIGGLLADGVSEDTVYSNSINLETRTNFGGRMLKGEVSISPYAVNPNPNAQLFVNGNSANGWTVTNPILNTTKFSDGKCDFTLNEGKKEYLASMNIINRANVQIHGGVLEANETWEAGVVHIVRHWVRIPQGKKLTVTANAIVKFCARTGIQVDGELKATNAIFTSIEDDEADGDTDMNGQPEALGYAFFEFTGNGTINLGSSEVRCSSNLSANTTWNADKIVHVMGKLNVPSGVTLTIANGAVVKMASGAELKANGGTIKANGAIFTHIADDSDDVGGDTNGDGDATSPIHDVYTLTGFKPDDSCDLRYITQIFEGGTIYNTKILAGNRVHHVTGNITIASGGKLLIRQGAIVKMGDGQTITIANNGELEALGNRARPVVFTSYHDDDHGGDTDDDDGKRSPQPGDWYSFKVSGTVNMEYVNIFYGGNNASGEANNQESGVFNGMSGGKITLKNCVIGHGLFDGIYGRANTVSVENTAIYDCDRGVNLVGGSGTFTNCVVDECRWGVMTEGGSATFVNCSVTNFYPTSGRWTTGWGFTFWSGSMTARHCNVWSKYSGTANYRESGSIAKSNMISADPLFTDAENGDFTLKAGSPLIDAGDGTVAPDMDYWGRPRMDVVKVADSGRPNDDGVCPDIGIFEMTGAYSGPCANLTVSAITAPATARAGQDISISWTIKNVGTEDAIGPWRDLIVLQGDDELGGQVVPLGEMLVTETLAPLDSVIVTQKFTMPPMKPGNWKIGVTTNAYRDVYEVKRADNQTFAEDATAVTLPVWSSTNNKFTVGGYGETGFALAKSNTTRIVTITPPSGAKISAYGADGYLPSDGNADVKGVTLANGTVKLVVPAGSETPYVTLANEGGAAATATVAVATATLSLLEVSPTTILNRGTSTMRIIGTGLSANSVFKLTLGSTTVTGQTLSLEDGLVAAVQFNVNNIAVGSYTLSVTENGSTKSLSSKITVKSNGIGPKLEAWLEMPPSVRDGRIYTAWLCYKNSGDADMTMPLFRVTCSSSTKISYTVDGEYDSRPLRYAGISPTAPAGVLKAGEENRVPVFFTLTGSYKLDFKTIAQNDTEHSTFGTWAEYGVAMAQAATRLNARGREEYRGTVIFDHALKEKNGQPCSAISGYVRNALTGELLDGFTIVANSDGKEVVATSDSKGYFQLAGLSGNIEYTLEGRPSYHEESVSVTIAANGDINGFALDIIPLIRVSGWITAEDTGESLSNMMVVIHGSGNDIKQTVTDEEGYYEITGILPGEYSLEVLTGQEYGGRCLNGLELTLNELTTECNFTLNKGNVVSGRVLLADTMTGISGVEVVFTSSDRWYNYSTISTENGFFEISGLPAGKYNVSVVISEYRIKDEMEISVTDKGLDGLQVQVVEKELFHAFPNEFALQYDGENIATSFIIDDKEILEKIEECMWDFDGDGISDSTELSPIYTYTKAGTYTVSLHVILNDGTQRESIYFNCVKVRDAVKPVLKEGVYRLKDMTDFGLVSYNDDSVTLQIGANSDMTLLKKGTILMWQSQDEMEAWVRKIEQVDKNGLIIRIDTSIPGLDEIYTSCDFSYQGVLNEDGSIQTRAEENDWNEINIPIGSGSLKNATRVRPTFFCNFNCKGDYAYLRIVTSTEIDTKFGFKVQAKAGINLKKEEYLARWQKPFCPGGIPILVDTGIKVGASLNVSGEIGLDYEVTNETISETGFSLTVNKKSNIYDLTPIFRITNRRNKSNSISGYVSSGVLVKGYIRADFTVRPLLVTKISPYVEIFSQFKYSALDSEVSSPEFDNEAKISLGIDIGIELSLFDISYLISWLWGDDCWDLGLGGKFNYTIERILWRLSIPRADFDPYMVDLTTLEVSFDDNSTHKNNILDYNWNFGDGLGSNQFGDTKHTYSKEGVYEVSLGVTGKIITNKKRCIREVKVKDPDDDDDPPPEEDPTDNETGNPVQSYDPNEISGMIGLGDAGTQRFVKPGEWLDYTVYFENKSTAAAPAQEVWVMHNLSKWLDWSTLELGEIGFNNQIQLELKGKARGTATIPQTGTNYHVQMNAAMDEATGEFTLYLRSYDKTRQAYGYWPESVYAGFLPPNDESHCGEGHFTFRVKVRDDAPDGAFVNAEATIIFDANAPITTSPAWFNWVTTNENPTADAMTLRWDTSDDAAGTTYVVNYWSGDPDPTAEGATETVTSDTLTTGSWKRPELNPGTYYWNVTKTNGDQSSTTSTWSFDIMAYHTLTVHGGIGSGSYSTNTQVTAEANTVAGKTFTGWTAVGLEMSEAELMESPLVFYMPDHDVELTANFIDDIPGEEDTQTLELAAGWNWVSFNVLPASHKVGDVLGTAGFTANDNVLTNGDMCLFTGTNWFPGGFSFEFGRLYQIYVAKAMTVNIQSTACESTSVPLVAGWNWIGNPTAAAVSPSQLTHSGGWTAGDRIQSPDGNVMYMGDKWLPANGLTLEPGKGCQIYTANAGTLTFPSSNGGGEEDSLYVVVDLSGGPDATSYPVRYSATGPDLNDDTCRTTELWLRRIPAGTFIMGSPEDEVGRSSEETQHEITLTQDYYFGVFECTQKQWELVMGSNPSSYKGDCRPVEHVSYDMIRGTEERAGAGWPTYGHTVDATSFMGILQVKTGLTFDLPTEAQWEYACRAGTMTALNSGKNLINPNGQDDAIDEVGRYYYNRSDGKGGYTIAHTSVGSYIPNAWGLYDMHGNVWEWCLDWRGNGYIMEVKEDPSGPTSAWGRVMRGGGCYHGAADSCRSAKRNGSSPSSGAYYLGFRVAIHPKNDLYVVVDLSSGPDAASYPVRYTNTPPNLDDDTCRTTELWLRKIPKGTFIMGSPEDEVGRYNFEVQQHEVTLTQDYYIGVFECTQRQWELVMGTKPSYFNNAAYYATRPVECVSYDMIRGTSSIAGAGWPTYGHEVDATSFMGKLQTKTGLIFDLPTEAQWEHACRAGTTTALNSGKNLTSTDQDANMAEVGRYRYNGGSEYSQNCAPANGTAKVGNYLPNAWGLYDMHGNVGEWCLDWWDGDAYSPDAATNPNGQTTGSGRVSRGGGWDDNANRCRSASRFSVNPSRNYHDYGFRVLCLPPQDLYAVVDLSGGPDAASYPVRYTNTAPNLDDDTCRTTELWLRRIPAGTFVMGSPEDELGRKNDETQHEVTLTQDYYIGVFECTQKQWELVMGTKPSFFYNAAYYATRPVELVSYDMIRGTDAQAGAGWPTYGHAVDSTSFMGKLQEKTGLTFDLPTEAQWEYACRAGTTTALNSGKNLTSTSSDANMNEVGRNCYNGGSGYSKDCAPTNGTAKVGSYLPNAWGLYDMHGNVWEWCLDWYGTYGSAAIEDPVGPTSGWECVRVLRGGGWYYDAGESRSAYRDDGIDPSGHYYNGGFRIACLP